MVRNPVDPDDLVGLLQQAESRIARLENRRGVPSRIVDREGSVLAAPAQWGWAAPSYGHTGMYFGPVSKINPASIAPSEGYLLDSGTTVHTFVCAAPLMGGSFEFAMGGNATGNQLPGQYSKHKTKIEMRSVWSPTWVTVYPETLFNTYINGADGVYYIVSQKTLAQMIGASPGDVVWFKVTNTLVEGQVFFDEFKIYGRA